MTTSTSFPVSGSARGPTPKVSRNSAGSTITQRGWVNLAAKRMQKIQMANADYIGLMVKALGEACPGESVTISTADMKAAYRQIALSDDSAPFALTCLYDPLAGDVGIHAMYGQPFGAGHAVPNFYRVAEWFSRFLINWFHLGVDHFFDDYWIVAPQPQAVQALACLEESAELMGITFDPDKRQPPSQKAEVLGVIFDTSQVATQRLLVITPKPSRVTNLCALIDGVLSAGALTSAQAASIIGKFGSSLTSSIRTSLLLIQTFATSCPPRQIRLTAHPTLHGRL